MTLYDCSKVVFLDTETTGLYPWRGHEVWEIGTVRWDGTSWIKRVDYPLPRRMDLADPVSLGINRFYDRTTSRSWDNPERVAQELARILDNKHVIGACTWFDIEMLRNLFLNEGVAPPTCHYHLLDIEALTLGFLLGTKKISKIPLPWKSVWLLEWLGIEPSSELQAHTALGDALKVKEVWDYIVGYQPTDD